MKFAARLFGAALALAGTSLPALAEPAQAAGRANYILHCSGCHGMQGKGTVTGGIPAFPESVEHIAGYDNGRSYIMQVPGVITTDMGPAEIADVLNFILDEWGSADQDMSFTADEVASLRALPEREVVNYRREIVNELRQRDIEIAEYPWP